MKNEMPLDLKQLKEKLQQLLKEKVMISKTEGRKFTVADLYSEAAKLVREEFQGMKKEPLSAAEDAKMSELAKKLSNSVLKEMKLI